MARDGEQLPKGWDLPIPEGIWPEALISAVRTDLGALSSPRAIETLRRWKDEARQSSDPRVQREAKHWLNALAKAMLSDDLQELDTPQFETEALSTNIAQDSSVQDAFTMDSIRIDQPLRETLRAEDIFERPPVARPSSRMSTSATPSDLLVEDDAIIKEENVDLVSQIDRLNREISEREGKTSPPAEFAEEDEKPTTLRKGGGFYRAARIDPFSEEDEKPTASINIPEGMQRRDDETTSSGTGPEVQVALDETKELDKKERKRLKLRDPEDDEDEVHEEAAEERTVASNDGPKVVPSEPAVPVVASSLPPPLPKAKTREERADPDGSGRLAPKPGIVRRRAVSRKRESQVRPRAAMQQVRALHAVVLPLCEELVPLSVERRSRRFWARWREVAGDRGVRRGFIEDLLQSAGDVRTMVCELIAEVQTVDLKSVYTLVQKIEAGEKSPEKPKTAGTPERQRGPMVGASVRVEGVTPKADDD